MKIFKELKKLGYIHYSPTTIEELDDLPLNSAERISEQALVLRWFREKYGLCIVIKPIDDKKLDLGYNLLKNGLIMNAHLTYEGAELSCLIKLIEIVKADDSNT
jgi:hypothetical protein